MLFEFWDFTAAVPPTDSLVWQRLNWRCLPGICYTGDTDTCLTGRVEAPHNVLYDEIGCEFIFRQPHNDDEVQQVIRAGEVDPFQNYGFDGQLRWDAASIRAWWRARQRLFEWIHKERKSPAPHLDQADGLHEFEHFLVHGAEHYLRTFAFFLEHRRCWLSGERLPDL